MARPDRRTTVSPGTSGTGTTVPSGPCQANPSAVATKPEALWVGEAEATSDGTEEGRKKLTGEDAMFLSDLGQDPGETRNLRRLHPNLVDELATMQRRWLEEVKTK